MGRRILFLISFGVGATGLLCGAKCDDVTKATEPFDSATGDNGDAELNQLQTSSTNGCIEHTFSAELDNVDTAQVIKFSWLFHNICETQVILTGKIYIQLTNDSGATVRLPKQLGQIKTVTIEAGDIISEAEFGNSFILSFGDEGYADFLNGATSVSAIAVFEGNIISTSGEQGFNSQAITIQLETASADQ